MERYMIQQSLKRYNESAHELSDRTELTNTVRQYHQDEEVKNKEYDCSMGLSNVLKSITVLSRMRADERKIFDVIIINALTMIRNCYDKRKTEVQIKADISKDINTLLDYVKIYFSEQKLSVEKPSIIVYLPRYTLPDKFMRNVNTEKDMLISRIAKDVFGKRCKQTIEEMDFGACKIFFIEAGIGQLPYKTIYKVISSRCNTGVIKLMNRRYLLVSHCPLDFHLQNDLGNKLFLLESYTGTLKSVQEFGKKVFKEDHVPFNQYTHLLLGDNVHVKPQVHRKDKQKILQEASKKLWDKKPLAVVLSDIRRLNVIPAELLTSIKF